jgi:hypothetical protein
MSIEPPLISTNSTTTTPTSSEASILLLLQPNENDSHQQQEIPSNTIIITDGSEFIPTTTTDQSVISVSSNVANVSSIPQHQQQVLSPLLLVPPPPSLPFLQLAAIPTSSTSSTSTHPIQSSSSSSTRRSSSSSSQHQHQQNLQPTTTTATPTPVVVLPTRPSYDNSPIHPTPYDLSSPNRSDDVALRSWDLAITILVQEADKGYFSNLLQLDTRSKRVLFIHQTRYVVADGSTPAPIVDVATFIATPPNYWTLQTRNLRTRLACYMSKWLSEKGLYDYAIRAAVSNSVNETILLQHLLHTAIGTLICWKQWKYEIDENFFQQQHVCPSWILLHAIQTIFYLLYRDWLISHTSSLSFPTMKKNASTDLSIIRSLLLKQPPLLQDLISSLISLLVLTIKSSNSSSNTNMNGDDDEYIWIFNHSEGQKRWMFNAIGNLLLALVGWSPEHDETTVMVLNLLVSNHERKNDLVFVLQHLMEIQSVPPELSLATFLPVLPLPSDLDGPELAAPSSPWPAMLLWALGPGHSRIILDSLEAHDNSTSMIEIGQQFGKAVDGIRTAIVGTWASINMDEVDLSIVNNIKLVFEYGKNAVPVFVLGGFQQLHHLQLGQQQQQQQQLDSGGLNDELHRNTSTSSTSNGYRKSSPSPSAGVLVSSIENHKPTQNQNKKRQRKSVEDDDDDNIGITTEPVITSRSGRQIRRKVTTGYSKSSSLTDNTTSTNKLDVPITSSAFKSPSARAATQKKHILSDFQPSAQDSKRIRAARGLISFLWSDGVPGKELIRPSEIIPTRLFCKGADFNAEAASSLLQVRTRQFNPGASQLGSESLFLLIQDPSYVFFSGVAARAGMNAYEMVMQKRSSSIGTRRGRRSRSGLAAAQSHNNATVGGSLEELVEAISTCFVATLTRKWLLNSNGDDHGGSKTTTIENSKDDLDHLMNLDPSLLLLDSTTTTTTTEATDAAAASVAAALSIRTGEENVETAIV